MAVKNQRFSEIQPYLWRLYFLNKMSLLLSHTFLKIPNIGDEAPKKQNVNNKFLWKPSYFYPPFFLIARRIASILLKRQASTKVFNPGALIARDYEAFQNSTIYISRICRHCFRLLCLQFSARKFNLTSLLLNKHFAGHHLVFSVQHQSSKLVKQLVKDWRRFLGKLHVL